jgi:hypothetical protein
MTTRIVVGLFESLGDAEDACHRLATEGVPERDCSVTVMHETGPAPATSEPKLAALSVDPMILGDVRRTFARFIRNGETALLVRVETEAEADFVSDALRLYAPIAIEALEFESA